VLRYRAACDDSGQTETKLTNDPVLANTLKIVDCVKANESVSGCRSFVVSGQRVCEFCHEILVSENSVRRHLLLHHCRIYVRRGASVYVEDDNEYAERCAKMRHNRSHRRAAARRRETATGSVSAGMSSRPAQNNRGTMTPQNNRGMKTPQNCQKTATRQQPSRAARGNPVANFPLPVASPTSQLSTFGWTPAKPKFKERDKLQPKLNGYGKPYTLKDRVPYPSHEGLQLDQFIKAKQYSADVIAYQRQCERDRRNHVESSTSGSDSEVLPCTSPGQVNYAFKRRSSGRLPDELSKSLTVATPAKPTFYLADRDVQLDTVDDVTSVPTMARSVSEGERAAVYLDAAEQSNFTPDFLDDFLCGHAKELDSEVGVLDYIGMSAGNAGLHLVEYAWASGEEDKGTTGGSPSSTVVRAEPSPAAPSAATVPVVDTSVSPIIDTSHGRSNGRTDVLPVDIVNVVALHPGLNRSRLLELVEERSVITVSDRQRQTIQQLLELVFISCQSAATSLEQHVEALNMAWDPGEDPAGILAVQKYKKALQVPFQLYKCLLEESLSPGDVEEPFHPQHAD